MTKLEEVRYIETRKEFVGCMPHTMLALTEKGKITFETYKETMKGVLDQLT
jgi:hypothetical protein